MTRRAPVFAIDVERSRALARSAVLGTWNVLDLAGDIEALLDVRAPRGAAVRCGAVDDEARARILGEQDLARRERRLMRAMIDATVAERFAAP